jgi:hypothetical protein
MNIVDMVIQVGGAREGQSFVIKISHLSCGKLYLLNKKTTTDPLVKKCLHYQTKQIE